MAAWREIEDVQPPKRDRPPDAGRQIRPEDEHNRRLVANVHPSDWTNPQPADRYHLVVVGAGTAGLVTAAGAAGLGAKVALVERHLMGGDCLNVGCVPSKAIIRSSRVVTEFEPPIILEFARRVSTWTFGQ